MRFLRLIVLLCVQQNQKLISFMFYHFYIAPDKSFSSQQKFLTFFETKELKIFQYEVFKSGMTVKSVSVIPYIIERYAGTHLLFH